MDVSLVGKINKGKGMIIELPLLLTKAAKSRKQGQGSLMNQDLRVSLEEL